LAEWLIKLTQKKIFENLRMKKFENFEIEGKKFLKSNFQIALVM